MLLPLVLLLSAGTVAVEGNKDSLDMSYSINVENASSKLGANKEKNADDHIQALDELGGEEEIPDLYRTSPDTTFTFEVNGRVLQPGESIYIQSGSDQLSKVWVGK